MPYIERLRFDALLSTPSREYIDGDRSMLPLEPRPRFTGSSSVPWLLLLPTVGVKLKRSSSTLSPEATMAGPRLLAPAPVGDADRFSPPGAGNAPDLLLLNKDTLPVWLFMAATDGDRWRDGFLPPPAPPMLAKEALRWRNRGDDGPGEIGELLGSVAMLELPVLLMLLSPLELPPAKLAAAAAAFLSRSRCSTSSTSARNEIFFCRPPLIADRVGLVLRLSAATATEEEVEELLFRRMDWGDEDRDPDDGTLLTAVSEIGTGVGN